MDRLQNVFNQSAVRDAVCHLLKEYVGTASGYPPDRPFVRFGLEAKVLSALGELPGVTIDDLVEAFVCVFDNLASNSTEQVTELYPRFSKAVGDLAHHLWRSDPTPVGPPAPFVWDPGPLGEDLPPDWRSADRRFSISFVGALPPGGADSNALRASSRQMYAQMRGECSRRFFGVFCSEATASLSGLLRCVVDLSGEVLQELAFQGVGPDESNEQAEQRISSALDNVLDISGGAAGRFLADEGDSEPESEMSYNSRSFILDGIAALFGEVSKKKDSIARRIKNATRLMIESFNQSHNAIGLALSVTAIEALLCRKSDNLAQSFAENMVALLEPDPNYRHDAERWCKRLYDLRSGVLHGSDLDCANADIRQAQVAAGVVLRAMLERRVAIKRVGGDDENPDDFLNELRSGRYVRGQLTHVSDMPLKNYWRKDAPKRIE
jgi:hypothetical protein